MSTNFFAVVAPCEHCGMAQTKPIHFGKRTTGGFTLATGSYHDADSRTLFLDDAEAWRAFLRRRDVVVRSEYRETLTKAQVAALWKLWRRTGRLEGKGWFR